MAEVKITQINLRPVQEFTGDRVKQAQRMNSDLRTGIGQRIHRVRELTHSTLLAGMGLGGLAYDSAWRRIADSWEFLDKAELRGEEIEQNMASRLNDGVHRLEVQAGNELRKFRVQLPNIPDVPAVSNVPGRQVVRKRLDWTVNRFNIRARKNGVDQIPLSNYDELSAHDIIDMVRQMDADTLESLRAYEANGKARVTVLRAIDSQLEKKLAVV